MGFQPPPNIDKFLTLGLSPNRILDSDFYLADILSIDNTTQEIKQNLRILLKKTFYKVKDEYIKKGSQLFATYIDVNFTDNQKAHNQFWNIYERPPKEEFWDYILERRDLLVPVDIRERKGAFFTPQVWVRKSQEYLQNALGEDYQEEYYIWDCAAGTGNLLVGLSEKYRIFASTLDKSDVDIMLDLYGDKTLLKSHIFQFDFLNDPLPCVIHKERQDGCFNCCNFDEKNTKIPQTLIKILKDPKERQKLIIYINPPYAEAPTGLGKAGKVAVEQSIINTIYAQDLGQGNRELFIQFFTRIYKEIPDCTLAQFSKLKIVQGQHFIDFRKFFKAKLLELFIVPSNTFDNVSGEFPIGFFIWDTKVKEEFKTFTANAYEKTKDSAEFIGRKNIYVLENKHYINEWIKPYRAKKDDKNLLGKFPFKGNDFQNNNMIQINHINMLYNVAAGQFLINPQNLVYACVYFAVRKSIPKTWLNDRDQFLHPNDKWQDDVEFQNDSLAFTLFNNNIQSQYGTNHFISFSEKEVMAREAFESHFMYQFINGKIKADSISTSLIKEQSFIPTKPLEFSKESKAVFDAGREVWRYYHQNFGEILEIHAQHNDEFYKTYNPNASLYDIKGYFQGFKSQNDKSKMNARSLDSHFNDLMANLRYELENLAQKIKPKIYEYEFLLE